MKNFAFTRCAACGSDKVRIDSKKEGYNIGKGIVGTAVFGTAGAVMGLNGKKQTYYHCPDCGQVLSYSMNDGIVRQINELMLDTVKNKRALEEWRKKYPNITWEEPTKNNKHTDDDLADMIWSYYLKHQIPVVKESDIEKFIENELSKSVLLSNAIKILEEKGVVIYEEKGDTWYLNFFTNVEDIQYNISKYNYQSNNSVSKFRNFNDKNSIINIFQEKYAKQEFTLTEFRKKIYEYILEQEYILKNDINDEICDNFFESLKATYRIKLGENNAKVLVHTLEEASNLFDISRKQKEQERNNKVNDYIPKIMEIMAKEKTTTIKIVLKKYPNVFLEKEKYIIKDAFEKLVAEEKIYMFENYPSNIYSVSKNFGVEEENEYNLKKKFKAIEWMLEEKNKKQAKEWDLVGIITENEPISIGDIRERVGIEKAIGEEAHSLSQALDYYTYVEKSIEKFEKDKKRYYITYGSSDRIIEKQKLLEKEQELQKLENKYANVVNNYQNCFNLLTLNEYKSILESLDGYKDSNEIIEKLNNKINIITNQQQKQKKANRKKYLTIISVLIIALALRIALPRIYIAYQNYKEKKQTEAKLKAEEKNEKIRIKESKIKDKLKSSITEVSKSEIDSLQNTSENKIYKQNWQKYIDYCGVFEYVSENNNTYRILSDFKLDNRFKGEAVWIVKNSDGSDIGKDTPNPFRIKVNDNYIYFFDHRNPVDSNSNKIVENEGKHGYIEATIEFKNNTIIYSAGYYEITDNYGKKENYIENFKYVFKKVK